MKRTSAYAGVVSRSLVKLSTCLVVFAILLSASPRASQRVFALAQSTASSEVTAVVEDVPELQRTVFDTRYGKLFLNLPKYFAPGETVSGTLFAEPAGQTQSEREKNADKLKLYAVEVNGLRFVADGKPFKLTIPSRPAGQTVTPAVRDATNVVIVVKDINGKPVKNIAFTPQDPPGGQPNNFSLPRYGQAGGFIPIHGPFDGEVSNSDYVSVGGEQALTLAESKSSKVVLNNNNAVGNMRFGLSEHGRVVSGDYRNLSVNVAVSRPTTRTGDQSTLTVKVGGLSGLDEDIPLVVENHSLSIVRMERGERQSHMIHPADVRPDGTFTLTQGLTSLHPGAFTITATVTQREGENRAASPPAQGMPAAEFNWANPPASPEAQRAAFRSLSQQTDLRARFYDLPHDGGGPGGIIVVTRRDGTVLLCIGPPDECKKMIDDLKKKDDKNGKAVQ